LFRGKASWTPIKRRNGGQVKEGKGMGWEGREAGKNGKGEGRRRAKEWEGEEKIRKQRERGRERGGKRKGYLTHLHFQALAAMQIKKYCHSTGLEKKLLCAFYNT
jgi:hypothetical protein